MIKIGIGQDSHRFGSSGKLLIGGIIIPDSPGLMANSDGDVVLHALCNALASSVGKGSLSTYADKLCLEQGIKDSREYLKIALSFVKEAGYKLNNVSISIEAKKPKLEKHFPEMKKAIAKLLGINENDIGITCTSGEELTEFGKGNGIQAIAIVSVIK